MKEKSRLLLSVCLGALAIAASAIMVYCTYMEGEKEWPFVFMVLLSYAVIIETMAMSKLPCRGISTA